jgi:Kef-type K+ transport system membrane component KefB
MVCSGIANQFHLSQIMACMFMGMTLANGFRRYSERAVRLLDVSVTPIYILFFVMIGAKLNIGLLPAMGWLGLAYVGARSAGKLLGSYIGARISHAGDVVRKYLGLSLFSQAGVAVGLSIAVAHDFSRLNTVGQELGTLVINVIAATTFVVQVIGPSCVKYSITKAGEVGKAKI